MDVVVFVLASMFGSFDTWMTDSETAQHNADVHFRRFQELYYIVWLLELSSTLVGAERRMLEHA